MELPDSIQVFSDKYLETISDAFKSLYNEEQLSDVTIYCKEGSLKAHKLILAASSPYFCKIFMENRNDYPILILQGTSLNQMKNLIDLLYHGRTNVKNDDIEALNSLIREFEIKGINFGPKTTASNVRLEICSNDALSDGGHNRDTRFKGRKRVAVDYEREENLQVQEENNEMHVPKRSLKENVQVDETNYIKGERTSPTTEDIVYSSSDVNSISDMSSCMENSENKLTAWARKQRKFKCDLCPSSFKRSSHLSRHQLVHTGERPYSCSRCEKAFSRHDKLKHHIRKAHEFIPDSMYERIDDAIDSDTESGVRNYTSPRQNDLENSSTVPTPKSLQRNTSSPLFTISHITSILEDSFVNPPKKGRGRPRKHPLPVSAASPSALNGNRELPVSIDTEASEIVENSGSNAIKEEAKKKRKKSWIDIFMSENENKRTSNRLREKRNINNNEDFMFSQMEQTARTGLFCEICDKQFVYQGRLNAHMKKIHGISNFCLDKELFSNTQEKNDFKDVTACKTEENLVVSQFEEKSNENEHKNFSYDELRELLPKECTIQPIVVTENHNFQSSKKNDGSDPVAGNLPQKFLTGFSVEENEGELKELEKRTKVKRKRKKKKVGIIRHTRTYRSPKSKFVRTRTDQQAERYPCYPQQDNFVSVLDNRENSSQITSPHDQMKVFQGMPQLNSAIEISIVNPKTKNIPETVISQNQGVKEDLSITIIRKLEELRQQGTETNLNSQDNNSEQRPSFHSEQFFQGQLEFPQKRSRGRPRKNSSVPPTSKRGRGRSKYPAYPPRLGVQNYNITNLPYGDLNYLTSQNSAGDEDESPAIMEPLVEINIDQFDHSKEADGEKKNQTGSSTSKEPTNVQICEDAVKIEQNDDDLHHVDISEIENKIGLIGECTISVAN